MFCSISKVSNLWVLIHRKAAEKNYLVFYTTNQMSPNAVQAGKVALTSAALAKGG